MILSRACQCGIQAVLYLASKEGTPYISIKEIADANDLSFHFLGKILQKLTQRKLLLSYKGPKGGVSLARSARTITLLEIVEAIDGLDFLKKCVVGLPSCGGDKPCVLHDKWDAIRKETEAMLKDLTIEQLIHTH